MKNSILSTSLAAILTLSSTTLLANGNYHNKHHDHGHHDMARVVNVQPIFLTHDTRWSKHSVDQHNPSYTPTIAGAIVGGVIGNQFGKGHGKTAMTVAGTLLGGSIARDLGYEAQPRHTDRASHYHSQKHHQKRSIAGYHVTYRYRGQLYSTDMKYHPGKMIPINVTANSRYRDF